jgi:hypothetical protein
MVLKTGWQTIWLCALPLLTLLAIFACEGHSNVVTPTNETPASTQPPEEVLRKLLKLAASTTPNEQQQLREFLSSKESLYKLDPRADHIKLPVQKLRVGTGLSSNEGECFPRDA